MNDFQLLEDDDAEIPSETIQLTLRIFGSTDDIGRLLDMLSTSTHPRVEFDPPGWTRTFYGWEKDIWKMK